MIKRGYKLTSEEPGPRGASRRMRLLIGAFLLSLSLAACGDVPVGPVDHSCHSGGLSTGSGCEFQRLP
jgi:hypothetical protein